jgi:hypothetical protein
VVVRADRPSPRDGQALVDVACFDLRRGEGGGAPDILSRGARPGRLEFAFGDGDATLGLVLRRSPGSTDVAVASLAPSGRTGIVACSGRVDAACFVADGSGRFLTLRSGTRLGLWAPSAKPDSGASPLAGAHKPYWYALSREVSLDYPCSSLASAPAARPGAPRPFLLGCGDGAVVEASEESLFGSGPAPRARSLTFAPPGPVVLSRDGAYAFASESGRLLRLADWADGGDGLP